MKSIRIDEKSVVISAILGSVLVFVIVGLVVQSGISSIVSRIHAKSEEYRKAEVLYNEIKSARHGSERFKGDILMFVQKLQSLPGLKGKILSASSEGVSGGIELRLSGLNLSDLVALLREVRRYSNLRVSRFTLKRNFTSSRLADVDMVVEKTQ